MKTCFPNHFFLKYELHVYTNRQGSEYFSQNVINVLRDVCCFCMAANQFWSNYILKQISRVNKLKVNKVFNITFQTLAKAINVFA